GTRERKSVAPDDTGPDEKRHEHHDLKNTYHCNAPSRSCLLDLLVSGHPRPMTCRIYLIPAVFGRAPTRAANDRCRWKTDPGRQPANLLSRATLPENRTRGQPRTDPRRQGRPPGDTRIEWHDARLVAIRRFPNPFHGFIPARIV